MLENKIREVFADMVVLKDPQRSEYFSKLSIPSYMRDWLVMRFSDEDGTIDYDSVQRRLRAIQVQNGEWRKCSISGASTRYS